MRASYSKKIFRFLILLGFIFGQFVSFGQGVWLKTQADVDAFDPATTLINGNLRIGPSIGLSDITQLSTLLNVITIVGDLQIDGNDILTNLDGLDNVSSVGGSLKVLNSNYELINIDGLNSLISVGQDLYISGGNLLNIDGLSNLTTVGGFLSITNNPKLTNINSLSKISSVIGDLTIRTNAELTNIDGLGGIATVGKSLSIWSNRKLLDIDGLNSLTSIGDGLRITDNHILPNIDGLSNITAIKTDAIITENLELINIDGLSNLADTIDYLFIKENHKLTNVDGLNGITSITGTVSINTSIGLINVDGLSNLISIGDNLYIGRNYNLSTVDGLINVTSIGGNLSIVENENITTVDGLINITSIGGDLSIRENTNLTNVDGLVNIISVGEDLNILDNFSLVDCCGVHDLIENKETTIVGEIVITNNPSECSSEEDVIESDCGMNLTLATTPPCLESDNGTIQVYIDNYVSTPFSYEWIRQEDGFAGSGVSISDYFIIEMLSAGTYNITVTNTDLDSVIREDVILSHQEGYIFEIIEVKTTNSSNGQSNGSITLTSAGGLAPYTYSWSGVESGMASGITDNFSTIPSLGYGEYEITIEDSAGSSKMIQISLLDEEVQVVVCEKPLDIVILNDVSGSVDPTEYMESKQFFVDFLQEINIGNGIDESRAAIIEWSESVDQQVRIPITGDITNLQSYINYSRAFSGGTSPHEAINFGGDYLEANGRNNVEKVMILSTDGSSGQISSSLIALADDYKAKGYHIISIAFDGAYLDFNTREILRQIASIDALAPGASAYNQLNANLAKLIVYNYLCPIDPGSSATAYFNRDGVIDITEINPLGNCPYPEFVEVTIDISARRELSIPAGSYVTFYHNNPIQSGATSILTWQIPCAIPVDSTDTYSITLPLNGPSNIFAVLNDDGVQGAPIDFPITSIEEIAYSNNIDSERVCLDSEATIQVLKYSALPIPACDTLVNYTINVCNVSEVDAFGVTVADVPPSGFMLTGVVFNDAGCATDNGGTFDLPADCCFSLFLTYDAAGAEYGYYGDQDVMLGGPTNQTYFDFDGSTTTDEDVTIDGTIDCPSTNITFTKSVNVDESCDDGFVEFTFTVTNEMNIPLQGLTFQDILPDPCTWAYVPYGESGLSIGNPSVLGESAIFTIDEVQANTIATFYMDASLNYWDNDGTLNNTATLGNVLDLISGGFKILTSNTTNTEITASPKITIADTIIVNASIDSIDLEAVLTTFADVEWTTDGDGLFTETNNENTIYVLGTNDIMDGQVNLFISAISECNETGASVLILFEDCSDSDELEIQLNADDLDCGADQVEIMVASNFALDSVSWSGPSNEGLIGDNLLVSLPGEYILIGYSGECPDTVSIIVEEGSEQVVLFESYTFCIGEEIIINDQVFSFPGSYQQTLASINDCDTLLNIELVGLEDAVSEETYSIHSGEVVIINGVEYDALGQYMQELTAANGCDSILIINILEDQTLITFDFDDCTAFVQTMSNADYSEFTPFYQTELECAGITASNIYRDEPEINMHSCTEGLNNSYSMCISSDSNCEFDDSSAKMVKMDIEINPNPNSVFVLTGIDFYQQGPELFDWINGDDGPNNYPTKFGLRILRDDVEIYLSEDNPTALTWQQEVFSFIDDFNFVFIESTTLQVQLLSYCPVGVDSPVTAWDLEDLRIFGSCSGEIGISKIIAGSIAPCANEILEDVQILLDNDSENKQVMIDEYGDYIFMGNKVDSHANITAYKDNDHLEGISSFDLLVLQRHLLGLESFENPLQYIAADINYDGKVSVADLRELRNLILGIYSEFPSNYSYRFLNKKDVRQENVIAWDISENIDIVNLSDHIMDADFVPVKIGDVGGQVMEYSKNEILAKNKTLNLLHIVKQQSSNGPGYSLAFNIDNSMPVNGLHFSIDLNGAKFEGLESQLYNFTEDNFNLTDDGILHISWIDGRNNINTASHLFTLNFKENSLNEFFNQIIKSEVYVKDVIYDLTPNYELTQKDEESISNLIVYPNPVNVETLVSFDSYSASKVSLSIHNLEGELVYKDVFKSTIDNNTFHIPKDLLEQKSGVYFIRLTNQQTSILEKIVVIN